MSALTLGDLVANRMMSPEMAASLAVAAEERRCLLFIAIPRLAGKTTTMLATLAHAPEGTPIHELSLEAGPSLGIPDPPDGGYLVMHEIAQTPFPTYLWGQPVRSAFAALRGGELRLATALHAGGVEEAFAVIAANAVPDEDAAQIDVAVYIRSLGPDWQNPTRRVVEGVHEIAAVEGGRVRTTVLHRWDEASDRFEVVGEPRRFAADRERLARRVEEFAARLEA